MVALLVMDWTGHKIRSVGLQQDAVIVQPGLRKIQTGLNINTFRTIQEAIKNKSLRQKFRANFQT